MLLTSFSTYNVCLLGQKSEILNLVTMRQLKKNSCTAYNVMYSYMSLILSLLKISREKHISETCFPLNSHHSSIYLRPEENNSEL